MDSSLVAVALRDARKSALLRVTDYEYTFAISRRNAPEVLLETLPSPIRGRGEDRVRAAPAVSQACCKEICCPRAYRFSGEHTGLPHAMALRLIRVRPGDRLSCHHRREKRLLLTSLTPAPGRQAHTTSPYAMATLVFVTSASTASHRTFVTIASAPHLGETSGIEHLIWVTREA